MKIWFLFPVFALSLFWYEAGIAAEPQSSFFSKGNWQIHGDGPHHLVLGLGSFDVDEEPIGAAKIGLMIGQKFYFIGPMIGFLANTDGGFFGYGGLYADIAYKNLVLTLMGGAGAYEEVDGKDLGGTFLFRSEITLFYQFQNLSRLGVEYGHLSNGGTHDSNPSEQDLFINFAIPF